MRRISSKPYLIWGIIIILVLINVLSLSSFGYDCKIIYNNKILGFTDSKKEAEDIIYKTLNNLESQYISEQDIRIVKTLNIPLFSFAKQINDENIKDLEIELKKAANIMVPAYEIITDNGEPIVYLDSPETADLLIKEVQKKFIPVINNGEKRELIQIGFKENINIRPTYIEKENISEYEEAVSKIINGKNSIEIYTIESGDTAYDIATEYSIPLSSIIRLNSSINLDRLQIGQKINIPVTLPLINIETKERSYYIEDIPYEIEYKENSSIYKGETKVIQSGIMGKKEVVADVISINGIEESRNILSEKITKEPQTKIIATGTKEKPKTMATGTFIRPAAGYYSSYFGPRWGSYHYGLDIANKTGTPIKAADGGKVIFTGTKGGYGKLVIIDHENKYQTRYGHLSSIDVTVGQRVYQGQTIGKMGSTGKSTGPHLHFEIRINGEAQNPLKYIR